MAWLVSTRPAQARRSLLRSRIVGPAALLVGLLGLLSSGCSRLPSVRLDPVFGRSSWVETRDAHVVSGPAPAIVVTLVNRKEETLSVRISVDEIAGANDCLNSLVLRPKQNVVYRCEQRSLDAGRRFRAEIVVYRDVGQTRIAERLRRLIEIERGEDGELELVGRDPD